ncbi:MAG: MFS transporter [Burkholderiaceae bacterium]|nr:MFS transporter [Burkholderiaceae bacterium]
MRRSPVRQSLGFQVGLLATMQALLLIVNVSFVAINGLVGFTLADNKLLATLPVTGYVLGAALWAIPAAALMARLGRRRGYTLGALVMAVGAALAGLAVYSASLWLLCLATFVCGGFNAFGISYRFAAADVADAYRPTFRAKAISLVLAGGIAGGVLGPTLAGWSRGWLSTQYLGTYLALGVMALLSLLLAQLLHLPKPTEQAAAGQLRPLRELLQPAVLRIAIICCAVSYGVMNLLMVATPLAMTLHHHSFAQAGLVLEWHVIGMYAPGFVTGALIARFGALRVILAGVLLNLACIAVALSGTGMEHFLVALVLLGVGWNFMYIGGTTLITYQYSGPEKNRVQGFTDACVFTTMVTSSASSGALLVANGWQLLNWVALPFVLAAFLAVLWLAYRFGWRHEQPVVSIPAAAAPEVVAGD